MGRGAACRGTGRRLGRCRGRRLSLAHPGDHRRARLRRAGRRAARVAARAPLLVGEAAPWSPATWHLAAPQGATLTLAGGPDRPPASLTAAVLSGDLAPHPGDGDDPAGTRLGIAGTGIVAEAGAQIGAAHGTLDLVIPAQRAPSHGAIWTRGAIAFDAVKLPVAVVPLGDTIGHLAARIAVKGTVPAGPLRPALDAWRTDGGTLELESLGIAWPPLDVAASATLALDEDLQPEGSGTATIAGYDRIVDALAAAGMLKRNEAAFAKIALGLLAKPRPDGTAEIAAPLRLQGGALYLGPARIARLPHIGWE